MKEDTLKVSIEKGNIIREAALLPAGAALVFQPAQDKRMLIIPFRVDKESGKIVNEEPKDVSFSEPFRFVNQFAKPITVGYVGLIYEKKKPAVERLKGLFSRKNIQLIHSLIDILLKFKELVK